MAMTRASKTSASTNKQEFIQTPFWLNTKTPLGTIGVKLTLGIAQHETLIAAIDEHGVEAINNELASSGHGEFMYVTEEGKSGNNLTEDKRKSLFDKYRKS